jgi:hypothetical protein
MEGRDALGRGPAAPADVGTPVLRSAVHSFDTSSGAAQGTPVPRRLVGGGCMG